ncbi:MFS transporter [Ammoniphilus sp. 3BR4]|uniref:MFS transporter n=1 Tax=Ammoniphilus sp. 3BR4 TaxID=3158265 RepID=UPI0034661EB7
MDSAAIGMIMFPGAMSAAVFGTVSGRLADRVGSIPIVKLGLGLLLVGYFGLSVFAGSPSWIIAVVLVICYLGFSTIQSSLANSVSHTLAREQIGVGMGIYNLFFFMAGAFRSTIAGKILDDSGAGARLNPWAFFEEGAVNSNLYLVFLAIILISLAVFSFTFPTQRKQQDEGRKKVS